MLVLDNENCNVLASYQDYKLFAFAFKSQKKYPQYLTEIYPNQIDLFPVQGEFYVYVILNMNHYPIPNNDLLSFNSCNIT